MKPKIYINKDYNQIIVNAFYVPVGKTGHNNIYVIKRPVYSVSTMGHGQVLSPHDLVYVQNSPILDINFTGY